MMNTNDVLNDILQKMISGVAGYLVNDDDDDYDSALCTVAEGDGLLLRLVFL